MNKIKLKNITAKIYELEVEAEQLTSDLIIPLHNSEISIATGPHSWAHYKKAAKRKFNLLKEVSQKLDKIEKLNNSLPAEKRLTIPISDWRKEQADNEKFGNFIKRFHW